MGRAVCCTTASMRTFRIRRTGHIQSPAAVVDAVIQTIPLEGAWRHPQLANCIVAVYARAVKSERWEGSWRR